MIYSCISQLKSRFCAPNVLLCIIKLWEDSKKLQLWPPYLELQIIYSGWKFGAVVIFNSGSKLHLGVFCVHVSMK